MEVAEVNTTDGVRRRVQVTRAPAGVAAVLAAVSLPLAAPPAAAMTIETECVPFPARYEDSWETVDSSSGRLTRRFGTLTWNRSGVDYEIREGFAVALCAASVDAKGGISSTVSSETRGPDDGRVRMDDLTGIGFGHVTAPPSSPERLPATGAGTPVGVVAGAVGLLAVGTALTRRSLRRGAARPDAVT